MAQNCVLIFLQVRDKLWVIMFTQYRQKTNSLGTSQFTCLSGRQKEITILYAFDTRFLFVFFTMNLKHHYGERCLGLVMKRNLALHVVPFFARPRKIKLNQFQFYFSC